MTSLQPLPGELEPIERASVDELRALQLERMQWSVKHAYDNVAHYRRAFDAKGVHPDDCRDLDDLRSFPFTTKDDLRAGYPFAMFAALVPVKKAPPALPLRSKPAACWAFVAVISVEASVSSCV